MGFGERALELAEAALAPTLALVPALVRDAAREGRSDERRLPLRSIEPTLNFIPSW